MHSGSVSPINPKKYAKGELRIRKKYICHSHSKNILGTLLCRISQLFMFRWVAQCWECWDIRTSLLPNSSALEYLYVIEASVTDDNKFLPLTGQVNVSLDSVLVIWLFNVLSPYLGHFEVYLSFFVMFLTILNLLRSKARIWKVKNWI